MRCKGSYTVEAAWIMTITVLMIFAAIRLGFQIYEEALEYIEHQCMPHDIDYVEWFRRISLGKDLIGIVTE